MDDTELHYVTYDPDAIWLEMTNAYIDAGGDLLYPGDEKEMLLRSVLADIVQVFAGVDNALRMRTLRYAVGDYLDVIGELRSCERIAAAAATTTVIITTNAINQTRTLAAGSAMTADGEAFYLLDEDLTLTTAQQTVTVGITADQAGAAGNGLLSGTQMHLAVPDPAINSIVVAADASGGMDREDDEAYRERIRTFGLRALTSGPSQQYEAAAMAVSSEIIDAAALNMGDGEVGVYLLVDDPANLATLIAAVEDALSDETTRPLTDHVIVSGATAVSYTLNVQYRRNTNATSITDIQAAADEYQEWQDQQIGLAFNPDRLMAMLYQAGCTRVIWDTGSEFDGGTVEYTEISSNEYCSGTITLTPMSE